MSTPLSDMPAAIYRSSHVRVVSSAVPPRGARANAQRSRKSTASESAGRCRSGAAGAPPARMARNRGPAMALQGGGTESTDASGTKAAMAPPRSSRRYNSCTTNHIAGGNTVIRSGVCVCGCVKRKLRAASCEQRGLVTGEGNTLRRSAPGGAPCGAPPPVPGPGCELRASCA